MRVTTILIFVVSCTVVAPAFYAAEFPWYIAPASEYTAFPKAIIPFLIVILNSRPWRGNTNAIRLLYSRSVREPSVPLPSELYPAVKRTPTSVPQ